MLRPSKIAAVTALLTLLIGVAPYSAEAASGLTGAYYNTATPGPVGTAGDFTTVDATINFEWTGDAPTGTPIVADDSYSERWTGYVNIPVAGSWTFTTTSNDGVRLWVDDQMIIDNWTAHPNLDDVATMTFANGGWYPIQLEHYNQGGTAAIKLWFAGPGQSKVIIPSTDLATVLPGNQPPEVDVGPDQTIVAPFFTATLEASVNDSDGIQHLAWSQVDGPLATITNRSAGTTDIQFKKPGVHTFRLTAIDTLGASSYDEVNLYAFDLANPGVVSGEFKKWHKISIDFTHDQVLSENSTDNPFLNYRLQVLFLHVETGAIYNVPGFFAADGDAANTSAYAGDQWRVNFTPDEAGIWMYLASFRTGPSVAVDLDPKGGVFTSFDGANGGFVVGPADPNAPGFRSQGRLDYVDEHHLRFAETGAPFLKGGTDSPENLLGYYEFDQTFDNGGQGNDLHTSVYQDGLHHFDAHAGDFLPGDPIWLAGGSVPKGRNLIGALNYLASKGVNSAYFLTYNIDGGDGREVWPWSSLTTKSRFDVSKLAQWCIVFDHMTDRGIALNVVTQETENDTGLDAGNLGTQRRLYYRELVARFAHNLGVVWNLGEENSNYESQYKAYASFLRVVDPYDHPITIHTFPWQMDQIYSSLLGYPDFEGPSIQADGGTVHDRTKSYVSQSESAGRKWFVCNDEQTPANYGVTPDAYDYWHNGIRRYVLWGNLMAQGAGVEYYFGYSFPDGDLDCENWRTRDHMWDLTRFALDFFRDYLPFPDMRHADELTTDLADYVLADKGETYVVYRPSGGGTILDLEGHAGTFSVKWFDPRHGGGLVDGTATSVSGPGLVYIGSPPPGSGDWVALIRRQGNVTPVVEDVSVEYQPLANNSFLLKVRATDQNGKDDLSAVSVYVILPNGGLLGPLPTQSMGGDVHAIYIDGIGVLPSGEYSFVGVATDVSGAYDLKTMRFEAP